jgi:O-acetyl-ADP-ribose deacetylase (regulator of RNase III)
MLEIRVGDMFTETLNQEGIIIVHGCNAQGVMGSGVAAIMKKLYPYAYLAYKQVSRRHGLKLGAVVMAPAPGNEGPTIANAITQEFYGRDGKVYASYDAIVVAMQAIAKLAGKDTPVHLPMIGGGLGGCDVKRLTAIFQAAFYDTNATLWLKEE